MAILVCAWNEGDGLGLDEGSIHERGIRVDEFEEHVLDDEGILVVCGRPVVLPLVELGRHVRVHFICGADEERQHHAAQGCAHLCALLAPHALRQRVRRVEGGHEEGAEDQHGHGQHRQAADDEHDDGVGRHGPHQALMGSEHGCVAPLPEPVRRKEHVVLADPVPLRRVEAHAHGSLEAEPGPLLLLEVLRTPVKGQPLALPRPVLLYPSDPRQHAHRIEGHQRVVRRA
mmetsp:Transcript_1472/g.4713  ORF Transcript_1472/g.4713 Transcript_1472/m.4713 type:complete len:230 (-) Transcript_1472:849-1538(-)